MNIFADGGIDWSIVNTFIGALTVLAVAITGIINNLRTDKAETTVSKKVDHNTAITVQKAEEARTIECARCLLSQELIEKVERHEQRLNNIEGKIDQIIRAVT